MTTVSKLREMTSLLSLPGQVARRQKEQWLAQEVLADLRLQRVKRVLQKARNAPYYNRILSGLDPPISADEPLKGVPLLDKKTIVANGVEAMLTAGSEGLLPVSTSGSTGHPMRFFRSPFEEAEFSARSYRIYSAFGGGPRDTVLNVGRAESRPRSGAVKIMRELGILPKILNISVMAPIDQSVRLVRECNAQFITGYAIGIENIADYIIRHDIQVRSPKAVLCGAMEVSDRCRELVSQAFNAPAVNVYVTIEFGVIGWECPDRRGSMHVNDDMLIMEIVDSGGRPVPNGTLGEVVLTSLTLTRMPLIRYRTGDSAARIAGSCSCGRGLGLMTTVQGRTAHTIVGPQGQLVTAPLVSSLITAASGYQWVRRFQLQERENGVLTLLVEPHCEPDASQKNTLLRQLSNAFEPAFKVDLELRKELPLAPTGKYQYVVPLDRSGR